MIVASLVFLASLAQQPSAGSLCTEWHQCRELALAAADRGDYEVFHDLAWRAVQTGPPKDPGLMLLLARAQSLSGRPHDALVMLQRLAEMGVGTDAATSDDFVRTRQLPGWPEVQARLEQAGGPDRAGPAAPASAALSPAVGRGGASPAPRPSATGAPATAVATPAPPAATPAPSAAATIPSPSKPPAAAVAPPAAEALRFSTNRLALGGLAYDSVSHRFLVGDRLGRKVVVVSEGSASVIDLVR